MSVMRSSVTLARFTVKSPLSVPNTYTCPLTTSDSGTTSARQAVRQHAVHRFAGHAQEKRVRVTLVQRMRHSDVFLDRERVARSSRSHAPEQWRLLRLRIARAAKRPASKTVLLAVDILKGEAGKFAEQDEEVAATRLRTTRLPRRNRGLRNLEALRKLGLGQPRINAHRPDVVADRIVRRIAHAHLPLPQQCYQTCIFPRLTRPCYPLN